MPVWAYPATQNEHPLTPHGPSGAHKLVERFGLNGDAPLQTFAQKADLLGTWHAAC